MFSVVEDVHSSSNYLVTAVTVTANQINKILSRDAP
jgi:hypothetical protein